MSSCRKQIAGPILVNHFAKVLVCSLGHNTVSVAGGLADGGTTPQEVASRLELQRRRALHERSLLTCTSHLQEPSAVALSREAKAAPPKCKAEALKDILPVLVFDSHAAFGQNTY